MYLNISPFALQDSKLNKGQTYTSVSYRQTPELRALLYWPKQFTQVTDTDTDSTKYWARTSSFWEVSPRAIWKYLRSSETQRNTSVPAITISALMKPAQMGLLVPLAMSTHPESVFIRKKPAVDTKPTVFLILDYPPARICD